MNNLFKDLINTYAKTIKELYVILMNVIKNYDELEKINIKNSIVEYKMKYND